MGTVRIVLPGRNTIRVCWFWTGQKGRFCFSCEGIRYQRTGKPFADDETLAFDAFIRDLYETRPREGVTMEGEPARMGLSGDDVK